ncbi:MAG: bifunctional (p)ppGpp synthetase/guanosine-3',5'-bis(diphosphate) 3'-pyrophosphohydrolase [Chitinophagales bacterium]|nr:bifunctional (p)ppGpp synthetase/guanosine-3',5'-bis(diphosphate) 3'-pyrophosphohydrolase [Chitinophagales bacterium]
MKELIIQNIDEVAENKAIAKEYRSLLKGLKERLKKGDKENLRLGFEMALDAHKDMRRKSGEPYIFHPIAVARIVSEEMGLDAESVICALLHDTVEDSELTIEDIAIAFGKDTSRIVDGLTKISGVFDMHSSLQAENFRKLILTLAEDLRVILIKIADRLHNMRTLDFMSPDKQMKIASETLFLYAPLANRIGLHNIKSELEDLSLKYTDNKSYREIALKLKETKKQRTKFINEFIRPIKENLEKKGFDFEIFGRPKSIYSIWSKIKNKGVPFEEVFDLFAIRIVLNSPIESEKADCWSVYSIITDSYNPSIDRLRDWISNPKSNGYEALHTTVMGPQGKFVEVQIRSRRMHEIAEKGVAAHYIYKDGKGSSEMNSVDEWLKRISTILSNPETNALDFVNDFKMDLVSEEIYVFTPKGDLKTLQKGSTALDFAFEIHTGIGKKCLGAKVNHKLVPLSYQLKNGDQIEILTSAKQKPSEDWLNFVYTTKAKAHIKQALKDDKRVIADNGKEILKRKLHAIKADYNDNNINVLLAHFKQQSKLDLCYEIAQNHIKLEDFKSFDVVGGSIKIKRIPQIKKEESPSLTDSDVVKSIKETLKKNADLLIMGDKGNKILFSYAQCCNPIPGDDVFGFITVDEGIKIHRTTCSNAINLMSKYAYRIVKTKWTKEKDIAFLTGVKINGIDDVGVINKVTNIISGELKINIRAFSIESEDGIFEGLVKVYVEDMEQLDLLIEKLKSLDGLLSVQRYEE